MRARRNRLGYTLIETTMALGVMTVGAVGIMGMQGAASRASLESHDAMIANNIAYRWIDRIRRDAMLWNTLGCPPNNTLLTDAPGCTGGSGTPSTTTSSGWKVPRVRTGTGASDGDGGGAAGNESIGTDYFGREGLGGSDYGYHSQNYFCTHMNLTWITASHSVRTDVRTFWRRHGKSRSGADVADGRIFTNCASGAGEADSVTQDLGTGEIAVVGGVGTRTKNYRLRAVHASTVVRWLRIR